MPCAKTAQPAAALTGLRRTPLGLTRAPKLGWGLAMALCLAPALAQTASDDCLALRRVSAEASSITGTEWISSASTVAGVKVNAPMCRVQGTARPRADSEIKFEVWLPSAASAWNGRLKVNGTGGYAGATPYPRLAQDVEDGFVGAGSNMGHDGGEAAGWTLGHPEKVMDWGVRAHYYVATAAKALSAAYYRKPVQHAYFEGCSNGGRQALMMAQNYPALFDGIVAGAPSNFYPDLLMWLLWTGKHQVPVAGQPPVVSQAKRALVTQRVLQACDAADGLVDGQITNPRACSFAIDSLGPQGDNSLSSAELAVMKAMYGGTLSETGEQRYTGARLGSEADWIPEFADNGGYGRFIGHFVYGVTSPPFDARRDLNFSSGYDRVKRALSGFTAAPSPDLTAFRQRGGKIVQYHGWNDPVVAPDGSIGYLHALAQFERLKGLPAYAVDGEIDRLTPQALEAGWRAHGAQVQQFHRLFMLPAMGHCRGGTGPGAIGGGAAEPAPALRNAEHHAVHAVIKWVEQGVAPERIVATGYDDKGAVLRQRPLCPYPAQARYNGTGDINAAASFSCQPPDAQSRIAEAGDLLHVRNALRQREFLLPHR